MLRVAILALLSLRLIGPAHADPPRSFDDAQRRVTADLGPDLAPRRLSVALAAADRGLRITLIDASGQVVGTAQLATIPPTVDLVVDAADRVLRALIAKVPPVASPPATARRSTTAVDTDTRIAKLEADLAAERTERTHHARAEIDYQDHAINVNDQTDTTGVLLDHIYFQSTTHRWNAYVGGDQRQRLEGADFYRAVGRADLAASYERRHNVGVGVAAGCAAMVLGGAFMLGSDGPDTRAYQGAGFALVGGGLIGFGIGLYYARHADPVSEDEARELAADYNATLRHRMHQTGTAHVRWMPFVGSGGGGGMALAGAF